MSKQTLFLFSFIEVGSINCPKVFYDLSESRQELVFDTLNSVVRLDEGVKSNIHSLVSQWNTISEEEASFLAEWWFAEGRDAYNLRVTLKSFSSNFAHAATQILVNCDR